MTIVGWDCGCAVTMIPQRKGVRTSSTRMVLFIGPNAGRTGGSSVEGLASPMDVEHRTLVYCASDRGEACEDSHHNLLINPSQNIASPRIMVSPVTDGFAHDEHVA